MRGFYGRLEVPQEVKEITIEKAFTEWQNYNSVKNLSKYSIDFYDNCISAFREFYDFGKPCHTIDEPLIFEYTAHLRTKDVNDITVNSYLRAVRAMCYYFMKKGYTQRFTVTMIKTQKQIKSTYTDNELEILLEKPKITKTTFAEYRNWVIINYLLATGNRTATICDIKIGDIDFDNDVIRLTRTKNRREQIIPLSKTIRAILKEFLKYRKGKDEDYLFCNVNGIRLSENGLKLAIRKYNQKRGVDKTSIHLFRHTFAKKWILNGGDVFRLQKMLGHSSMEIVREYVNMFGDDLKRDFDIFNPLEEFTKSKGEHIKIPPKKPPRITL